MIISVHELKLSLLYCTVYTDRIFIRISWQHICKKKEKKKKKKAQLEADYWLWKYFLYFISTFKTDGKNVHLPLFFSLL